MADDDQGATPLSRQQTPLSNGSRYDELEKRVRAIEDTINKATGVMSMIRWLLVPIAIIGAAAFTYLLGQGSI